MTELLFGRHGESSHNLELSHLICGRNNDIPLTHTGERQARLLGAYLRSIDYTPDAIYSSGAVRADMTARIAAESAGLDQPIIIDERLQEVSQGPYEGRLRTSVYNPETIAVHNLNSVHGKLPGAESLFEAYARMSDVVGDAYHHYPDGRLLIFSHGLAIRSLTGIARGHTKRQIFDTVTPNASLTSLTVTDSGLDIHYVGKTVISE
jgi:broad specificity phosphatase PhoE